jgi:ATP-dependent Clp protease ATP-binding subunit ClpA
MLMGLIITLLIFAFFSRRRGARKSEGRRFLPGLVWTYLFLALFFTLSRNSWGVGFWTSLALLGSYGFLTAAGVYFASIFFLANFKKETLMEFRQEGNPLQEKIIDNLINVTDWTAVQKGLIKAQAQVKVDWAALSQRLHAKVIGQSTTIDAILEQLKYRWDRLKKTTPVGVFLFSGESGTGKTYLCKELSTGIYGEGLNFLRIDCGELCEKQTAIHRLIGAPPQYVGGEGQLTAHLSRYPSSVVLFDEIEKADPGLWDVCLALFDEGRITDQHTGQVCDGTRANIILTSNLEKEKLRAVSEAVAKMPGNNEEKQEEINSRAKAVFAGAMDMARGIKVFRPELLNRIDAFFIFTPLSPLSQAQIAALELQAYAKSTEGIDLQSIDPNAIIDIVQRNMSAGETGAREMRKIAEKLIRRQSREARLAGVIKAQLEVRGEKVVLIPLAVKEGADRSAMNREF